MKMLILWLKNLTSRINDLATENTGNETTESVLELLEGNSPEPDKISPDFVNYSTAHVCKINRLGAQSIADAEQDQIEFDTVEMDTASMASLGTHEVIIKRTGYYRITASAGYNTVAAATPRLNLEVRRNNTPIFGGEQNIPANGYPIIAATDTAFLNYGDKVQVFLFQNSGAPRALLVSLTSHIPRLTVEEIPSPPRPAITPLRSSKFTGYGDSQTQGNICGVPYGPLLTSQFTNKGYSGYTSADLLAGIGNLTAVADVDSNLILWIGPNDVGLGVLTAAQIVDNIQAIAEEVDGLFKSISLITLGPANFPAYANNAGFETLRNALNAELVSRYSGWAQHIIRLDLNTTLGQAGDEANRTYYSDGLHITETGQGIVAAMIDAELPE